MPFYYDVNRVTATSGTTQTEVSHLATKTGANQETVGFTGLYVSPRGGTAGGLSVRLKHNTGTAYSGGTAATAQPRNLGHGLVSGTTWVTDATAITPGTTLVQRLSIGGAATGGMGYWVATEQMNKVQMMPGGVSPIDCEITSLAQPTAIPIEITVEFSEGM